MSKAKQKVNSVPKTKVTKKNSHSKCWSGVVSRHDSSVNVEVNSISNLLARCAKASAQ